MELLKSPKSDVFVMLSTFLLTVFVDLAIAIEAGVVLSALLFMNRMANTTIIRRSTDEMNTDKHSL